jgi:hypothetical protein
MVNKSRRRQVFAVDGDPIAPGAETPLTSNTQQFVGDYTNPILKPQAAESVKRFGEIELSGGAAPTPSSQCWPEPLPYIFWNLRMQSPPRADEPTPSRTCRAVLVRRFDRTLRRRHARGRHHRNQGRSAVCHSRYVRHALYVGPARGTPAAYGEMLSSKGGSETISRPQVDRATMILKSIHSVLAWGSSRHCCRRLQSRC